MFCWFARTFNFYTWLQSKENSGKKDQKNHFGLTFGDVLIHSSQARSFMISSDKGSRLRFWSLALLELTVKVHFHKKCLFEQCVDDPFSCLSDILTLGNGNLAHCSAKDLFISRTYGENSRKSYLLRERMTKKETTKASYIHSRLTGILCRLVSPTTFKYIMTWRWNNGKRMNCFDYKIQLFSRFEVSFDVSEAFYPTNYESVIDAEYNV